MIRAGAEIAYNACKTLSLRAVNKLSKLEYIVFEITDACNSRCRHCNIWRTKPTKNLLTAKEIENIFNEDMLKDAKSVLITGGEPVLREDIMEVIQIIHKALPSANITLSTNGLLPDRVIDTVKFAKANNVCLDVGVSLDAVGEQHDEIRGVKGNFEKTSYLLEELKKLKANNKVGNVVVGFTLSHATVKYFDNVAGYAAKFNFHCLPQLYEAFEYYHNEKRPAQDGDVKNYHHSDNTVLIEALEKMSPTLHNEILIDSLRNKLDFRCFSMQSFFLLHCDGEISPCLRFSNTRVGNLKKQSLQEIWYGEKSKDARKLVKNCKGCSNTWGSGMSYKNYFFPFWGAMTRYLNKKYVNKTGVSNR